jgi:hypothetical protein
MTSPDFIELAKNKEYTQMVKREDFRKIFVTFVKM